MTYRVERVYTREMDPMLDAPKSPGDLEARCERMADRLFNGSKLVDVTITGADGGAIYEGRGLKFPEHFSQQACDIIASKYFRVAEGGKREESFYAVVARMVWFWADSLEDEGLLDGEGRLAFMDEACYMLIAQIFAPNSPQWFNTGVGYYDGGRSVNFYGMWHWDRERGKAVETKWEERSLYSQTSACFILSVCDSLLGENSITDHYVTETKLFKGGSGVGTNFSPIRAKGEALTGGGTSSGVMSFLDGLDRNAGAIKSGGTTRRAAKMVILDIDHPEIEDFIDWKVREERKAKALVAAGYDGSMGGEAYSTVSGQNSNNSVRVSGEFMRKVKNLESDPDATITLVGRTDGGVTREAKVSELWEKIAAAAWECADPGIQFDDRYNEWNTCAGDGFINATNPCSEFAFLDDSACNLASIDVFKFLGDGGFDFGGFEHTVEVVQLILEASIHRGMFPTRLVAMNSHMYRPTGLGMTNLASLFLKFGVGYDSPCARRIAGCLAAIMTGVSYRTSQRMAEIIGPFEAYEDNRNYMYSVLCRHWRAVDDIQEAVWVDISKEFSGIEDEVVKAWDWMRDDPGEVTDRGFRNAQVTVMAPTGTISFAMDCGATGIEPFYSHTLYKKCSDGSFMEITNPLYDPSLPDEVLATANEISPHGHLAMMAAIQPFISGSISKTVNMPNSATVEDIKNVYLEAYEMGLKSVSIYRDGSKGVQPLTTTKEDAEENDQIIFEMEEEMQDNNEGWTIRAVTEEVSERELDADEIIALFGGKEGAVKIVPGERALPERVKPDGIRESRTHAAKIGNVELYITIGYYPDGSMAELFASSDKDGTVVKGLLSALSKSVSYMLQYGIEPKVIAQMLRGQKFEPAGVVGRHPNIKMADSIADLIARVIEMEMGDYTRCHIKPDGSKPKEIEPTTGQVRIYEETCSNCGSVNMIQSGTCKTCMDCGTTTGCA